MPGTIFVREVLRRVSVHLQDMRPQFYRWLERELVGHLNEGAMVICRYLPMACTHLDAIKLAPGTLQSIASLVSSRVLRDGGPAPGTTYGTRLVTVNRNMGEDGITPGKPVTIADRALMDAESSWHEEFSLGEVDNYAFDPRFPKLFYVSPGVDTDIDVWLEVGYNANPSPVSQSAIADPPQNLYAWDNEGSSTVIPIDDEWVDLLVDYIVARANMKDSVYADKGKAAAFTTSFNNALTNAVQAMVGVNPNLTRLPLGSDKFTAMQ